MTSEYYNRVNTCLLDRVPPGMSRIVEIGCGAGALGRHYKSCNSDTEYIGIEIHETAARIASKRLDKVINANAEDVTAPCLRSIARDSVDCLIYGDVLEHMVDPWRALKAHTDWLRDTGVVVACIPNIQHWTILVNLMCGEWRYRDEGLLDRTHLRFFTLKSIHELFAESGLRIMSIEGRRIGNASFERYWAMLEPMVRALEIDGEGFRRRTTALQFVVKAIKRGECSTAKTSAATRSLCCKSRAAPNMRTSERTGGATPTKADSIKISVQTAMFAPRACAHVRVLEPNMLLENIEGVRTCVRVKSVDTTFPLPYEQRIAVLQRPIVRHENDVNMLRHLMLTGYLVILEYDDDPSRRSKHRANNFLTFRACHCVQTASSALARFIHQYNPHVTVFQNHIGHLPPIRTFEESETISVFFGAINREREGQYVAGLLDELPTNVKQLLKFIVVHDKKFFRALNVPTDRKTFEPFCSYEKYKQLLSKADIGLLPLFPTTMNMRKSDLKFIEFAAYGVVAIASPTVYDDCIEDGHNGFLFTSPQEFRERFVALTTDLQLRQSVARRAYEYVKNHRTLRRRVSERYHWYRRMLSLKDELTKAAFQRTPELGEVACRGGR